MRDYLYNKTDAEYLCQKLRAYWSKHNVKMNPRIEVSEFLTPDASRKTGFSRRIIYSIRSDLKFGSIK